MTCRRLPLAIFLLCPFSLSGAAGEAAPPKLEGVVRHMYKQTPARPLYLYSLAPEGGRAPHPAIVFFFGGGWKSGTVDQFDDQARHLTGKGLVSILVDYRVISRDNSTPFDSVRDARSALRWVRGHAAELGIDPQKIVASGGSAGGHVAGATAILDGIDDPADDRSISPAPNALVLFNPVLDTTEAGYGAATIGKNAIDLSLTHHVRRGLPPTILFHGMSDHTVPYANAVEFRRRVEEDGGDCKLVSFEGADHGFFNSPLFRKGAYQSRYDEILQEVDRFLTRLGLE